MSGYYVSVIKCIGFFIADVDETSAFTLQNVSNLEIEVE
jgi:hypothetical protein